ncbi:ribose-phosphate pyrophosphokinase [Collinsella tanakaei]|uniref:Ribose-phosphate pyrophosphokinase n=2 Tax=Actinomycetota TaxID=201174 RepID=A0AAW7JZI4_9ACTN|nr:MULTISPECIES: ribose-phosphate pyrophosphokinase [Collinsella]MBM6687664.1 ribose-phosphate pyrophosphokinase [Collinsella tanakaei]MBM6777539.1 ribose-phosphate pyrophosphokinase [Collinsella tanakaei]MBM6786321.1 ribose-phosphate pyrophosphokinase [Collinsella tanakaei]MBM6904637.1 ribose-phosphate pyrophosphokinase [Collinsella tanakaei]MCF6413273.1 ribose-phosphate pyrophosphokinase [Collinsella tanakaei]
MPTQDQKLTQQMYKSLRLYSGSCNRPLAQKIADILGVELSGLALEKFANGEIYARFDESVRGADVFLVQSIAGPSVNDMLMELLVATDAAKRASARTITAVITHYAYARQDRKAAPREPITARLVANLLERAGVDRIITLDLHQGQIQGFFDIPVNQLSALPLFGEYYNNMGFDTNNLVVVSPDVGRAKAAKMLSDMLGCDLAIAHKGRPRHNAAEVMGIIGDIEGKTCIINDDMIDTAGTLCASVRELKKMGAGDIYVCASHGIFSGPAIERLNDAPIVECVVTDSIPVEVGGKIKTITVANEFADAISAVYGERSVSKLIGGDFAL